MYLVPSNRVFYIIAECPRGQDPEHELHVSSLNQALLHLSLAITALQFFL